MSDYASLPHPRNESNSTQGSKPAPGKRTLTQSIPANGLRAEQRETISFDTAHSGEDFYDQRATVDTVPTPNLTNSQLAAARRKNPNWMARLNPDYSVFSLAPPDTNEFAFDVASKQQANGGLKVDGIAGPRTVEAIAGSVSNSFDEDDPFGMHLIG